MNLRLFHLRFAMTALFVFGLLVNFSAHAATFDAKIEDISNRSYYDATISEINTAKDTIYVAMYSAYIQPTKLDSPTYKLIEALVNVHTRGVAVKVYLDSSKGNSKGNGLVYEMLKGVGVPVYFIDSKTKMHAKVILIDETTVITGSANWTDNAADLNVEHNVILRSKDFAVTQLDFFKELDKIKSEGLNRKAAPGIRVPARFIDDRNFAAAMVHNDAAFSMRLYLKLLKDNKPGWVNINYEETARYLGIKVEKRRSNYRTEVRSVVDDLKSKYGLLDYRFAKRGTLQVRLNDYDDKTKDYRVPEQGYFEVPMAFWQSGLDKKLTPLEELSYFICLYEGAHNAPKLYWWMGFENMEKQYHISREKLSNSFVALERMGLIAARRYPREPGKGYDERKANEFRLLPLLKPLKD